MIRQLKILGLPLVFLSLAAVAQPNNILVDPAWLSARMTQPKLVILQVGMGDDYKNEHITGAVFIDHNAYTVDNDPHVFDLPAETALKALLEEKGVSSDSEVVLYTSENLTPFVTRLYFTLNYLGYGKQTHILDGGLAAWKAAGKPVTAEVPAVRKGSLQLKPNPALLADQAYVLKSIGSDKINIVDCRAPVFYNGIEPTHGARKGRIPGAKNIPYNDLYEKGAAGSQQFKSAETLAAIFKAQGISKDKQLVLYCHIGLQMTVVYTAARMLGYEDIKVYDGSFHEWGPNNSLPIEID